MALRLVALATVLSTASCFVPEDAQPQADLSVAVASQYVRRGMPQVATGVVQPQMGLGIPTEDNGQIDLMVWANMDMNNDVGDAWFPDGHAGKFTEIDLIGGFTKNVGEVLLSAGIHNYNLPNGLEFPFGVRGTTSEAFLHASTAVLGVRPSLEFRYDFDEVDGVYIRGGLVERFPISDKFSASAAAWIGYSSANMSSWDYGISESGFSDLLGVLTVSYRLGRSRLALSVSGSTIIDNTIDDWFNTLGIDSDNIWTSLTISWRF